MSITSGLINSVIISGTNATINITPPVDASYDHTQIIYKRYGASNWIVGNTNNGTQGVAGNVTQSGINEPFLYIFSCLMADSASNYSLPSNSVIAINDEVVSESNLFIENTKVLLSNSQNFMDWTNTTTTEDAKLRISDKEISTLVDENPKWPLALVYYGGNSKSDKLDTNNFIMNSDIEIIFINSCSDELQRDESQICRDLLEITEKIIADIKNLEGVDGFLIVNEIRMTEAPSIFNVRDNLDETEDLVAVKYLLQTGV